MRKAISFVLVGLLLVSALVACDAPDGKETATTEMTADVTSTKTTAETTSPETTPDDSGTIETESTETELAVVGMTYDELMALPDSDRIKECGGYLFYVNDAGENVVVDITNSRVTRVESFVAVNPSRQSFAQIEKGMDLYEVVALVGIPHSSPTFGAYTMMFIATDGTYFSVEWDADHLVTTVSELNQSIEENN